MTPPVPICQSCGHAEVRAVPRAVLGHLCTCGDDDCPLGQVAWPEFVVRFEGFARTSFVISFPRISTIPGGKGQIDEFLHLLVAQARRDIVIPVDDVYLCISSLPATVHDH